jgi:hypothetical protein
VKQAIEKVLGKSPEKRPRKTKRKPEVASRKPEAASKKPEAASNRSRTDDEEVGGQVSVF